MGFFPQFFETFEKQQLKKVLAAVVICVLILIQLRPQLRNVFVRKIGSDRHEQCENWVKKPGYNRVRSRTEINKTLTLDTKLTFLDTGRPLQTVGSDLVYQLPNFPYSTIISTTMLLGIRIRDEGDAGIPGIK